MDYFNLSSGDFMACEVCGAPAVDIHHIEPRGMGGKIDRDSIDNLIALCRCCHELAHSHRITKSFLREHHVSKINSVC